MGMIDGKGIPEGGLIMLLLLSESALIAPVAFLGHRFGSLEVAKSMAYRRLSVIHL